MHLKITISLVFLFISFSVYSQSSSDSNIDQYLKKELVIGSDYFNGIKVYNSDTSYTISSFGLSSEFIDLVSVSSEAKTYINNVNGNLIGGLIIDCVISGGAGTLLWFSTIQNSQQNRFIYSISSIGGLLVAILVGNIFINNGYDNLFKAVDAYNRYLLSNKS